MEKAKQEGDDDLVFGWLAEGDKTDPSHPSYPANRETILNATFGPKISLKQDEVLVFGTIQNGVTRYGVWSGERRVPFAAINSVSLVQTIDQGVMCDFNCTLDRRLSFVGLTVPQSDDLLAAASQFKQLPVVPTLEEQLQMQAEKRAEANRTLAAARRRELLALSQAKLLQQLVKLEAAPRVYWGVIF
ncbi:MAG: hypothetical protein ABSG31_02785 [Tepidisphaeraceae bacterium]|jgi:hypothetical protein